MTSSELGQRFLNRMYELVVKHYDKEELKTLCFNLNIDYDNLMVKENLPKQES